MNIYRHLNMLSFFIFCITIYSILPYPSNFGITYIKILNVTAFWFPLNALILYIFWGAKKYFFNKSFTTDFKYIKWFLLWNIVCVVRGVFIASTYWDYKLLVENSLSLLMLISTYAITNKMVLQSMLFFYFRYALPLFAVILFFTSTDSYGFYLVPISFLFHFYPILSSRWKWTLTAITLFVVFSDFGARSNVIKFILPIALVIVFYFDNFISTPLLEIMRKLFFIIPFFLFVLGVSGAFNVFKINDYIKGDAVTEVKRDGNDRIIKDDLKADTRTFLYIETLKTAVVYDSWLFGRSPARGTISKAFGKDDMNKRGERNGNEVAILNIFIWTGLIGVILYFLIFYHASYLAINQSNNRYSKILGISLAFRWVYAWVEDVNNFSLNNFFIWILIAVCLSKQFRSMDNKEIKIWVRGIFDHNFLIENNILKRSRQRQINAN